MSGANVQQQDTVLDFQERQIPAGNLQINPTGQAATITTKLADIAQATSPVRSNGMPAGSNGTRLALTSGRNADGSTLAAAATSGKFGQAITLGTSYGLISQAASSSTITDTVLFETTLPNTYVPGQNITLLVDSNLIIGSGTVTGSLTTLAPLLYGANVDGSMGADLLGAPTIQIGTAATQSSFVTTSTASLTPGKRIFISIKANVVETSGNNVTAVINSVGLR